MSTNTPTRRTTRPASPTHRPLTAREALRELHRDLADYRKAGALPGRGDDVKLTARAQVGAGYVRVAFTLAPARRDTPAGWHEVPVDPTSTDAHHLDATYAGRTSVLRADLAAWAALAAEKAHQHLARTGMVGYVTVTAAGTTIA